MKKRKRISWDPTTEPKFLSRRSWARLLVRVLGDPFDGHMTLDQLDMFFARVASSGQSHYVVSTSHFGEYEKYLRRVGKEAVFAAAKYERRMRAHFRRYKNKFTEGYSLPGAPTPALRFIYDRAATIQNRPTNPDGTTLHKGFDLGEYHWREWPLNNLVIVPAYKPVSHKNWLKFLKGAIAALQAEVDRNIQSRDRSKVTTETTA